MYIYRLCSLLSGFTDHLNYTLETCIVLHDPLSQVRLLLPKPGRKMGEQPSQPQRNLLSRRMVLLQHRLKLSQLWKVVEVANSAMQTRLLSSPPKMALRRIARWSYSCETWWRSFHLSHFEYQRWECWKTIWSSETSESDVTFLILIEFVLPLVHIQFLTWLIIVLNGLWLELMFITGNSVCFELVSILSSGCQQWASSKATSQILVCGGRVACWSRAANSAGPFEVSGGWRLPIHCNFNSEQAPSSSTIHRCCSSTLVCLV